jgi:hypothetical protein
MISYIPKARMLRTKRLRYRGNSRLFQAVRQLTACETEHVRMAWRLQCASACPALPWNMRRAVRKERCCTRSSLRNSKHSCEGSKTGIEPYRILSNRNFGLFGLWRLGAGFSTSSVSKLRSRPPPAVLVQKTNLVSLLCGTTNGGYGSPPRRSGVSDGSRTAVGPVVALSSSIPNDIRCVALERCAECFHTRSIG